MKFIVLHPALPINLIRKVQEDSDTSSEISENSTLAAKIHKIHVQPIKDLRGKTNKYVLQFHAETPKEIKELREKARQPLINASDEDLEVDDSSFDDFDMPKRPSWDYKMKKEIVLANEERYFFKYVTNLEKKHYDDLKHLSCFELNIETWRQLWRVIELSDILLIIIDARYPTFLFPPYLFKYVTEELKKHCIVMMNKIDLVESSVVLAWKKYFEEKYKINVVLFTSYPSYNLRGQTQNKSGLQIRRRKGRMRMACEGAMEVYKACSNIVKNQVDLSKWHNKIQEEINSTSNFDDDNDDVELEVERTHEEEVKDFDFEEHELFKNGVLSIGTVGFPNVGKSSILNGLMGKKVVSISRTPGHTKHFQTIFLTENVRLVDCPGLVFPSQTPKIMQVLLGSYPIAQLREPYASVKFLAERVDLPKLLSLKHPEENSKEWSAMDICEAFAIKRGYMTAKAARPDTYRAANSILRMALDGKIALSLKPKNYHKNKSFWESHPELQKVKELQALGKSISTHSDDAFSEDDDTQKPSDYALKAEKKSAAKRDMYDKDNEADSEGESDECNVGASSSNQYHMLNDENE